MQTLCLHVLCFYQLLLLQKPRVASLSCINKIIRHVEPLIGNVVEHFNLLSANPTKWPNTLKQFVGKLPTNCLSVFGHFVNLVLKRLIYFSDGMSSQLSSRFVFHFLTKIQLEKNITCNYNERAHGKGPMNGIGGIVKNLVIREGKSGHCITGSYTLTVCFMYQRNLWI